MDQIYEKVQSYKTVLEGCKNASMVGTKANPTILLNTLCANYNRNGICKQQGCRRMHRCINGCPIGLCDHIKKMRIRLNKLKEYDNNYNYDNKNQNQNHQRNDVNTHQARRNFNPHFRH